MAIKTADDGENHERRICNSPNWALYSLAVDSGTVISEGDLLWKDDDDVKPCSDFPWDTDEDTTRAAFIAKFVGVAMTASADGETQNVIVANIGKLEFDINAAPAADLQHGVVVGPAKASGNALLNQILKNAATTKGIGFLGEACKTTDVVMIVQVRAHYVPTPAS